MFEKIKKWYARGLWTAEMVLQAVEKGVITPEQAEEIIGEKGAAQALFFILISMQGGENNE